MKNHVTLIGCPKLDAVDYTEKLAAILTENNIKSVTVVRMEVPCCGTITATDWETACPPVLPVRSLLLKEKLRPTTRRPLNATRPHRN